MKFSTKIDKKLGVRMHKVAGEVTVSDILAELKQVYSKPDFDSTLNVLWDLRQARLVSTSSMEVDELSRFVADHWGKPGGSRGALVVSRDFEFGLTRMYEVFLESKTPNDVTVFRDYDEALEWIKS